MSTLNEMGSWQREPLVNLSGVAMRTMPWAISSLLLYLLPRKKIVMLGGQDSPVCRRTRLSEGQVPPFGGSKTP